MSSILVDPICDFSNLVMPWRNIIDSATCKWLSEFWTKGIISQVCPQFSGMSIFLITCTNKGTLDLFEKSLVPKSWLHNEWLQLQSNCRSWVKDCSGFDFVASAYSSSYCFVLFVLLLLVSHRSCLLPFPHPPPPPPRSNSEDLLEKSRIFLEHNNLLFS